MRQKISLEDLIDKLCEIQNRFTQDQSKELEKSGIVFSYDIDGAGTLSFQISKSMIDDLENLYK